MRIDHETPPTSPTSSSRRESGPPRSTSSRRASWLPRLASLALSACGEDVPGTAAFRLEPSSVDLGLVPVGGAAEPQSVTITSTGDAALVVDLAPAPEVDALGFRLRLDKRTIDPGDTARLEVGSSPESAGPARAQVALRTNAPGLGEAVVALEAWAFAGEAITVSPRRVDFGNARVGTRQSLAVTVTNGTPRSTRVRALLEDDVAPCGSPAAAATAFCVRLGDDGPSDEGFELAAGATARIEVVFEARLAGTSAEGQVSLELCRGRPCEARVALAGRVVESGLRCRPAELDFGLVPRGTTSRRTLTCDNVANEPLVIAAWGLAPGTDTAFETEPFGLVRIEPSLSWTTEVTFAPTVAGRASGLFRLETDRAGRDFVTFEIPLFGAGD